MPAKIDERNHLIFKKWPWFLSLEWLHLCRSLSLSPLFYSSRSSLKNGEASSDMRKATELVDAKRWSQARPEQGRSKAKARPHWQENFFICSLHLKVLDASPTLTARPSVEQQHKD